MGVLRMLESSDSWDMSYDKSLGWRIAYICNIGRGCSQINLELLILQGAERFLKVLICVSRKSLNI
jgi:hypothetical protein